MEKPSSPNQQAQSESLMLLHTAPVLVFSVFLNALISGRVLK